MKRIILVLVLLVTWSLASVPSLTTPVQAGEVEIPDPSRDDTNGPGTLDPLADSDDDSEGDPGDLGDGYGAVGDPRITSDSWNAGSPEWVSLEEYFVFLMLMVQLLAP